MACATSAFENQIMRIEADSKVKKKTGIKIEIIDGKKKPK